MTDKLTIRDATLHLSNDGNTVTVNVSVDDPLETYAFPIRVVRGQKEPLEAFFERHAD